MEIGDKVRFLNDIGGGVITGFHGKDIVLVQDGDGFEVPVNRHECVVIDADEYNIDYSKKLSSASSEEEKDVQALKTGTKKTVLAEQKQKAVANAKENRSYDDENDKPVTFKPAPEERRGADVLNVYLCFVPIDKERFEKTEFDVYLVNDSNYFLDFTYLCGGDRAWQLHFHDTAEPNTKMYMETIGRDELNDLHQFCLQMVAYKEGKPFMLKPALSVELRPDLTKFYKLHTFLPNDFFVENVLTFNVVVNDKPVKEVFVNAEDISDALLSAGNKEEDEKPHIHAIAIKKEQHEDIDIVDLHATALLDDMKGMKSGEILEYQLDVFRKEMEKYKNQKGKKLIFIHGKGQGVLRNAVLRELNHNYKNCTSQDASFREYGFGATMVIIH